MPTEREGAVLRLNSRLRTRVSWLGPVGILIYLTLPILFAVVYSYYLYDTAKVIAFLRQATSVLDYHEKLGFGAGISYQIYFINYLVDVDITVLRAISYGFFVSALAASLFYVAKNRKFLEASLLAVSLAVFMESDLLAYLGSYGMLVYCQSFFIGVILFLFVDQFDDRIGKFKIRQLVGYYLIFFVSTLIQLRFSFYLCMAFAAFLFVYRRNGKKCLEALRLGLIAGVVVGTAVLINLIYRTKGLDYQPAHVEPLLFSGGLSIAEIGDFVIDNSARFIRSLVGNNAAVQGVFLAFLVLGIAVRFGRQSNSAPVITLGLVLGVQLLASIFEIYPFGSIRYTKFMLPFFVIFYLEGVMWALERIQARILGGADGIWWKRSWKLILVVMTLTIILAKWGAIEREYARSRAEFWRHQAVVGQFLEKAKSKTVYCDIVTEKTVKAHGQECEVLTTWNLTRALGEEEGFYDDFERKIRSKSEIALLLWKPLSYDHYSQMRKVIIENNFNKVKAQRGGPGHYLYLFRK